MEPKLFVIDGLDGCGKTTQFEILSKELQEKYDNVKAISFPEYDKPSSALVRMYLDGEIASDPADVNPYAASSFYAVDRYASYKMYWEKVHDSGGIILASRYVSSNAIHQMSKLPDYKWDGFLEWLADYEYDKLELPKPDCVIFLDMPVKISQDMLLGRYNGCEEKRDIHESSIGYLEKCRTSALYAAEKRGWHIVECSSKGRPLLIDEITDKIREIIYSML